MPLAPLQADPVPTEADIAHYLADEDLLLVSADLRRPIARIKWKSDLKARDPNAFLEEYSHPFTYSDYLTKPLWASIRAKVLVAASHQCVGCFAKATEVHHRDYRPRVMAGQDLDALVAICALCHRKLHVGIPNDDWAQGEKTLAAMVAKKDRLADKAAASVSKLESRMRRRGVPGS